MRKGSKRESGMTTIGFAMILMLVGVLAVMVVKVMPVYLENFKVSSAIKGLVDDDRAQGASAKQIKTLLIKKLSIDDVEAVNENNIFIETTNTGKTVNIKYETRVSIFKNIDAVILYESDTVELR